MKILFVSSVWLFFYGSFLGIDIGGHVYIGNIAQLLSVALALTVMLFGGYRISMRMLILLAACIGTVVVSIAWTGSIYSTTPQLAHSAYFLLCFIQLFIFDLIIKKDNNREIYLNTIKKSLLFLSITLIAIGVFELFVLGIVVNLQFADKSHASVALGIIGLMCLRSMPGAKAYLIAFVMVLLNFATISKLSIIFGAATVVAMSIRFIGSAIQPRRREPNKSRRPIIIGMVTLVTGLLAIGIVFEKYAANESSISVFDRLGETQDGDSTPQTKAHLELIRLAAEIKLRDPMIFAFGAGPSGFSGVAANANIDLTKIEQLDPAAYQAIFEGIAPMHSAHLSMLVEFSLLIGAVYLWMWIKPLIKSILAFDISMIIIIGAVFSATTFYSTNHLTFFWAFLYWMWVETSRYQYRFSILSKPDIMVFHGWKKWKSKLAIQ